MTSLEVLRARSSLFSLDSKVSKSAIFGTNLGVYCAHSLYKGPQKNSRKPLKALKNMFDP